MSLNNPSGGKTEHMARRRRNGVIKHSPSNSLLLSFIRSALLTHTNRDYLRVCVCVFVCTYVNENESSPGRFHNLKLGNLQTKSGDLNQSFVSGKL